MHSMFTYAQPSPLCYISSIIRKRFSIWTSSRLCHNIFMSASSLALRRSKNIGNFLVRAKLRNPSQNTIPPRLFSRRQPLFYVHRHIKLALLLTYFFSSAKEDLLLTTLSATLKTLLTGFSANPVKRYKEKQGDEAKIASTNTTDQAVDKPTNISEHFFTDHRTANDISVIPSGKKATICNTSNKKGSSFKILDEIIQ